MSYPENYISFDPTGANTSIQYGGGPVGVTAIQTSTPTWTHMQIPAAIANTYPVPLAAIQAFQCDLIDGGADAVAASLVTLSPRRVQTDMALKEECDTYVAATSAATNFPFLSALAAANGTTLAQEQVTFQAGWAELVPPGALINATAEAAKRKVAAATNLAEIAAAATINWPAVMATLPHA